MKSVPEEQQWVHDLTEDLNWKDRSNKVIQQNKTKKQVMKTSTICFFCLAWIEDITIAQLETVTHIV